MQYKFLRNILFILLIIFLGSCSNKKEEVVDISGTMPLILVVGQSNAEGLAPQETAPEWLKKNNYRLDNFIMWNKDNQSFQTYQSGKNVGSDVNSDTRFGFDIFFAKRFLDTYGGKLLCIKHTRNMTPISEKGSKDGARWQPKVELIADGERKMMSELEAKIKAAYEYAEKHNCTLKPVAILFIEGESDGFELERLADFEENLTNFIVHLKNSVNSPDILTINTEIIDNEITHPDSINAISWKLNTIIPNFKTICMEGKHTTIGDNLHFDHRAQEYIGNAMFDVYEEFQKQ